MSELHKKLLAITGLVLIATGAVHYVFLQPKIVRNRGLNGSNVAVAKQLEKMKIPELKLIRDFQRLSPVSLKKQQEKYGRRLVKRFARLHDVLKRANEEFSVLFDPQLTGHRTVQQWRDEVLSLDYSAKFHDVKDKLGKRSVYLWEPVLGLRKEEVAKRTEYYRLIAQLHVVEQLALLAVNSGLDLKNQEWINSLVSTGGKTSPKWEERGHPAMIRVLTPRILYAGNGNVPYADEFPVQMSVRGKMEDLCRFLDGLTQGGRFLPLERIEVNVMDASKYTDYNELPPSHATVEARIVCSGFLVLADMGKMRQQRAKEKKVKPRYKPGA